MTLLHEIQTSLMQEGIDIGPILLKLRFLASRLGSDLLEDWVKHESGGYPADVPVPDYRKMHVSYKACFNSPPGSAVNNAPIPPYIIEKYAGKQWNIHEERQSVAAIDDLIQATKGKGGTLNIENSNLILLLQGNVYPGYACNSVTGFIPVGALVELQSSVRNRILELTIKLEKEIPVAATITVGSQSDDPMMDTNAVTQITNQVIHNYTEIHSSGADALFVLNIGSGDTDAFTKALTANGIPEHAAREFAAIVSAEQPQSKEEPFGERAREWLVGNLGRFADGSWRVGVAAGTNLLTEAAMRFYGFK